MVRLVAGHTGGRRTQTRTTWPALRIKWTVSDGIVPR